MNHKRIPLALLIVLLAWAPATVRAELLYGLTQGQHLVTFDSQSRTIGSSVQISGLGSDSLIGIDFRPATGQLYGMGSGNRFYTIDTSTGAATPVGNSFFMIDIVKSFDFDPVTDTIRVLTNLRKNIVVNPNTGAITQQSLLNYAAGDANYGTAPEVVQGAYTNSMPGAKTSTLYTLEAAKDVLAIQSPESTGTLSTVGSLGLSLGTLMSFNGMDISGATGIGYIVGQTLLPGGLVENTLYTINLATGRIQSEGGILGTPSAGPLTFGGSGKGGWEPDPWDCGGIQGAGRLIDVATVPVPEPATWVLAACGLTCLVWHARRKQPANN